MFGGVVEGREEGVCLGGDGGDVEDVFVGSWICRGFSGGVTEEVGDGELGGADWVGEVDVEEGVARGGGVIEGWGGRGGVPEGGPGLFGSAFVSFCRCSWGKGEVGVGRRTGS